MNKKLSIFFIILSLIISLSAVKAQEIKLFPPKNLMIPTLAYSDTSITIIWEKPDIQILKAMTFIWMIN